MFALCVFWTYNLFAHVLPIWYGNMPEETWFLILRMYLDLPRGVRPFCRSGANPFQPAEVLSRLRESALALQRRVEEALQPQE